MIDIIEDMLRHEQIAKTQSNFDLDAELTEAERLLMANQYDTSVTPAQDAEGKPAYDQSVLLKALDDDDPFAVTTPDSVVSSNADYNEQYVFWMKNQAIAALGAYDEGWKAFIELVLSPYVHARLNDDNSYSGDDRDKAFALRLRRHAAYDFAKYILSRVAEAGKLPKPTLAKTASGRIA